MTAAPRSSRKRKAGARSSAWIRPRKRYAVYARDGFTCVWCGASVGDDPTLDHLFPRSHRLWENNDVRFIVTSCRSCNLSRKATRVSIYLRHLKRQGRDILAILFRLQRARYVPINRAMGARALAAIKAINSAPLPPLRGEEVHAVDGIPY